MLVVPRPASTVVVMDEASRIYLTKRPETMKFLGGYYVFPGGAVDERDYDFALPENLSDDKMVALDYVHYVAAARELFEEVGIFITKDPFTLHEKEQLRYRKRLISGEISLYEMVQQENLSLDLSSLAQLAHFTTPEASPIRFSTRFFHTKLPANQIPMPDDYEIADAMWLTPEESLEASSRGELLLSSPTIKVLKKIIQLRD